jgi:hypothetical protein
MTPDFAERLEIAVRSVEIAPRWFAQFGKVATELRKAAGSEAEWRGAKAQLLAACTRRNRTAEYGVGQLERVFLEAERLPLAANGRAPHAGGAPQAHASANSNGSAGATSTTAGIPFVMRATLLARGFSGDQIANMRPAEAHQILAAVVAEQKPSLPPQPEQEPARQAEEETSQEQTQPADANGAGAIPPEPEPPFAIEDMDLRELIADPDSARVVADVVKATKHSSVDKLKEISEARRKLDLITQSDAVDFLSEFAINNLGLDPDAVQLAFERGARLREQDREEWAVPGRIPLYQPFLLSGEGGGGKSTVLEQLCAATALGRDWLGAVPQEGPSLFGEAEDQETILHARMCDIAAFYGVKFADLIKGGLHRQRERSRPGATIRRAADQNRHPRQRLCCARGPPQPHRHQ